MLSLLPLSVCLSSGLPGRSQVWIPTPAAGPWVRGFPWRARVLVSKMG